MEKKEMAIILGVLAIVIAAIVLFSISSDNNKYAPLNEGLIETDHFDLTTEEGSTANGTIFYIGEEDRLRVLFVADLNIVPSIYSTGFYMTLSDIMGIVEIYSDYEEETPGAIELFRSSQLDEDGYPIQHSVMVDYPTFGGSGAVIIDCTVKPTFERGVDALDIFIQLGEANEHFTQTL